MEKARGVERWREESSTGAEAARDSNRGCRGGVAGSVREKQEAGGGTRPGWRGEDGAKEDGDGVGGGEATWRGRRGGGAAWERKQMASKNALFYMHFI